MKRKDKACHALSGRIYQESDFRDQNPEICFSASVNDGIKQPMSSQSGKEGRDPIMNAISTAAWATPFLPLTGRRGIAEEGSMEFPERRKNWT